MGKALFLDNVFPRTIRLGVVAVGRVREKKQGKGEEVREVKANDLQGFFPGDFVKYVADI